MQVNLTKIYNIGTLFKVRFIQDSGLFSCRFRQMSLCLVSIIVETFLSSQYANSFSKSAEYTS
jgi:hypothetical protein